jgi:hypothetical protein
MNENFTKIFEKFTPHTPPNKETIYAMAILAIEKGDTNEAIAYLKCCGYDKAVVGEMIKELGTVVKELVVVWGILPFEVLVSYPQQIENLEKYS